MIGENDAEIQENTMLLHIFHISKRGLTCLGAVSLPLMNLILFLLKRALFIERLQDS